MAETTEQELTAEEAAKLASVQDDADALAALVDELGARTRRKRQFAARVLALVAQRDPEMLAPYIGDMIDALEVSEAQTRWEVLDALTCLVESHGKEVGAAYEGAETALFDELSSTLRFSAFRFLCSWGATDRGRSKKVWPLIDEAIQCYHGDLEYHDMLVCLHEFAQGKIEGGVAGELAARLKFDAENGKGAFLKAHSSEIYDMLVKRFKLDTSKKRKRATVAKDEGDSQENDENEE